MSCKKNKDGKRWDVSFYYTAWNGDRIRERKTGFKTKGEAQEYEREFLQNHSGTPNMTFSALVDLVLEDKNTRVKPQTYDSICSMARHQFLPFFGKMRLEEIKPTTVRQWQTTMINNGYSAGTLRAFHTKLSAIFNYAVRFYGLSNNPAKICGTMGTVQGANMDIWTTDQLERAAATIREPEVKVLLELLFWTGLRIGEALALLWGDLEDNVLHITKTKDEKHRITTPKTQSSVRDVILPDSIVQMLMDYKQHCVVTDADAVIFPVTHKLSVIV